MFERFTDRARRVVVLAQEEARLLNHNYIGTEHVLLGLIHEGEGVAAKALESLGIKLEAVRREVEQTIGRGKQSQSGHIPFTPRAKKALELSLREALQLNHNYIGTEHILLGLIREGEGVAAQVLIRLGGDLDRVRQQVIELLHGQEAAGRESSRPFGAGRAWERTEVLKALNAIHERLSAIERHLGITKPPAGEAGAAAGGTAAAAAGASAGDRAEAGAAPGLSAEGGAAPGLSAEAGDAAGPAAGGSKDGEETG
jgi:ATP-dependent Clp protease ATP-binding subunit ClpA